MPFEVAVIDPNRKYWMIRTQAGDFYDEFYHEGFIAINWNEFSDLNLIPIVDEGFAVERIKQMYPDEKRAGHVFKQIRQFTCEINIGDVVLIPSENSKYISFGVVTSDTFVVELNEDELEETSCPFVKRRRVNWIKTVQRNDLDPYLYRLLYSHHTITNASTYSTFIDRTLHSFFLKGDKGHLVLQVTTQDRILAKDMSNLIAGVTGLLEGFNEITNSNINTDELELKVNVQSPGPVEFIVYSVAALAVLGMGIRFAVGGKHKIETPIFDREVENKAAIQAINSFRQIHASAPQNIEGSLPLADIERTARRLGIDLPKELRNDDDK